MALAMVTGNSTYQYLWSDDNAQETEMATNLAPGTYTVTVTDELGCTQEITTMVEAAMQVDVMPSEVNGTTCADPSSGEVSAVGSGGSGNFNFEWFDNANMSVGTGQTLGGLPAGTYNVLATDDNGCEAMQSVTITSDVNTPDAIAFPAAIDCNFTELSICLLYTSPSPRDRG